MKKTIGLIAFCMIASLSLASEYKWLLSQDGATNAVLTKENSTNWNSTIPKCDDNYDWKRFQVWLQDTNNVPEAADPLPPTIGSQAWQDAKSPTLKSLENMYVTFLTNDWTVALRGYSIIDNNTTINVTNTSESANVTYLMQVRALDTSENKPKYSYLKGEFESFKNQITERGGIMSFVISH